MGAKLSGPFSKSEVTAYYKRGTRRIPIAPGEEIKPKSKFKQRKNQGVRLENDNRDLSGFGSAGTGRFSSRSLGSRGAEFPSRESAAGVFLSICQGKRSGSRPQILQKIRGCQRRAGGCFRRGRQ